MKRTFLSVVIMLLCGSLMAQHITLCGRVADSQSDEPLPFANAALYDLKDTLFVRGCTSGLDGRFAIKDVVAGTYLMRVSMVGYETWERILTLTESYDICDIRLTQGTILSEVEVTAARPIFTMDGEKNIYNTSDDPSIQSGSAVDALQNAPGIEIDAEGNIRLRGNQEVGIWINGRESRMTPEALKQYLKTLPANSLKRIEVISNPSARYGGGRPVVNIVTQGKSRDNQLLSFGINGSSKPEAAPWISYICNNEKWEADLYANLAYLNESMTQTGQEALLAHNGDTSRTDTYTRKRRETSINAMVSADIAYHPDSLTAVYAWGALIPSWTGWDSHTSMQRIEHIYLPGNYSYDEHAHKALGGRHGGGFMDGIWMERTFDESTGHSLMGGYYGSLWQRDSLVAGWRKALSDNQNDLHFSQSNIGRDWFHCIEANYLRPFGRVDSITGTTANELESGIEASITRSTAITETDTTSFGDFSRCEWMSSIADAATASAGAYASLLRRWKRLSVKGGLRLEAQNGSILYPDDANYNFSHKSVTITPSIHLTYTTAKQSTFALGYTYRTGAPGTADFSSRKSYTLDGYSTGNPLLKNSATHNLEVKWDMYRDRLGSIGVNCYFSALSNQKETMTDVAMDNDIFHRIVTFCQPVNVGSSWKGGLDLHAVYRPNAFVNVRLNVNLYYDQIELDYRNERYSNGMLCYSLRLNTWVKIWNKVQLFGNVYYTSPTQSLFNTTLSRKGIDLGVNADLFDRRLSLNIGVNDLFDWNSWSVTSANPYLMSNTDSKPTSRYVSISATLRFGKTDLKGPERRGGR